jgi:hypothetical protein
MRAKIMNAALLVERKEKAYEYPYGKEGKRQCKRRLERKVFFAEACKKDRQDCGAIKAGFLQGRCVGKRVQKYGYSHEYGNAEIQELEYLFPRGQCIQLQPPIGSTTLFATGNAVTCPLQEFYAVHRLFPVANFKPSGI